MVGQSNCLKFRDDIDHWKYKNLNLDPILFQESMGAEEGTYHAKEQNHMLEQIIDWKLIEAAKPALENAEKAYGEFDVVNTDRSIGTVLSHEVTKIYRGDGLPDQTIHMKLHGSAGHRWRLYVQRDSFGTRRGCK